jgi:benzoyl-CoA reductase/2-hydroxyglutaryl-CoA dehydratase subunit BcrC/BadD/HgdB
MRVLQEFREKVKNRPAELTKLRQEGAVVIGWSGYNIPEEYFHALDIVPVRIAIGGNEKLVEIGARYISPRNCVYVRELLGHISENRDPLIQQIDSYAFDATCLQTFRAAELVEFYFKKDVFVLGVPRNFHWEEAQRYFVKEAESFVKTIEEKYNRSFDTVKLQEAVMLYNRIRKSLETLQEIQIDSEELTWAEVNEIIQAGYILDKNVYAALLDKALAEAGSLEKAEKGKGKPRVFLSGSILPPGDTKLVDIITELGGRIVGDDLWSGILPYLNVDIRETTIEGVALGYLNRTPHGALPYLELETDRRLKKLKELIAKTRAAGVVYHTLRYCDPFSFKALETKQVLAGEDIPFLEIHTEYASSDTEGIRTRIEAFLELLEIGQYSI